MSSEAWGATFGDERPQAGDHETFGEDNASRTDGSTGSLDPFQKVLSKEDSKQMLYTGKVEDAAHFFFVCDDKLEFKLTQFEAAVIDGRLTCEDATKMDPAVAVKWHRVQLTGHISHSC